jgi:hypothetical protein
MSTKTLREVLEPFAGRILTLDVVTRMREVIEEWGNETGNVVYPVAFESGGDALTEGAVNFDVTFECVPKGHAAADVPLSEWLSLLKKPTDDSGTK